METIIGGTKFEKVLGRRDCQCEGFIGNGTKGLIIRVGQKLPGGVSD